MAEVTIITKRKLTEKELDSYISQLIELFKNSKINFRLEVIQLSLFNRYKINVTQDEVRKALERFIAKGILRKSEDQCCRGKESYTLI